MKALTALLCTILVLAAATSATASQEQAPSGQILTAEEAALLDANGHCTGDRANGRNVRSPKGYYNNLRAEGVVSQASGVARSAGYTGGGFLKWLTGKKGRVVVAPLDAAARAEPHYGCWQENLYIVEVPSALHVRKCKLGTKPKKPKQCRKGVRNWVVAALPPWLAKSNARVKPPADRSGWQRWGVDGKFVARASNSDPAEGNVRVLLWTRQAPITIGVVFQGWRGNPLKFADGVKGISSLSTSCDRRSWSVTYRSAPQPAGACTVGATATVSLLPKADWEVVDGGTRQTRVPRAGKQVNLVLRQLPPRLPVFLSVKARKWTPNGFQAVRLPAGKYGYELTADGELVAETRNPRNGVLKRVKSVRVAQVATLRQTDRPKKGSFWYWYRSASMSWTKIGKPGNKRLVFNLVYTCARKHINPNTGNCRRQ